MRAAPRAARAVHAFILPFLFLAWSLAASPARGQAVEYGGLEALFGEPVTEAVTGKAQRTSDAPANIEIVTADDIRRSGADNLPDILRFVPGVDVRRYGLASAEVSIRGYNTVSNPRLLVLVNGQQVYLDDFGRTQWYALPVEIADIRQIEVVKGPNSALYGFNAASGVINIVTWDPLRDKVNTATVRGGTQDYGAASASGTARFGAWGAVRLSAGGFRARDFAVNQDFASRIGVAGAPRRGALSLDARFRVAPGVEAGVAASHVNLRAVEPVGSPFDAVSRYDTNAVRAFATAETRLGMLSLNAYRNELSYVYDVDRGETRTGNAVAVVQASDLFKLGASHAVRLGAEFRDNSERFPRYGSRVGYKLFAGSIMWDWQVSSGVSVTNAARLDHLSLNHSGPLLPFGIGRSQADYDRRSITDASWNSGVVWHVTDLDTVRVLAARGLQAPSLTALGHQDSSSDPRAPFSLLFRRVAQPAAVHRPPRRARLRAVRAAAVVHGPRRGVRPAHRRHHRRPLRRRARLRAAGPGPAVVQCRLEFGLRRRGVRSRHRQGLAVERELRLRQGARPHRWPRPPRPG